MGPVEVLIVTFPSSGLVASIGPLLDELVAAGHLRVVDAILVANDIKGELVLTDLDDSIVPSWSSISVDPRPMLGSTDAELAAADLGSEGAAIIIAIEHTWPRHLAELAADSGGTLELHARIDPESVAIAARVSA